MGKYYHKKTNRSKRKMHHSDNNTVTVSLADGKASFQMVLPMSEILFDVAGAIEQTASEVGLRMMKALVDEEVEQLTGDRCRHQPQRQAIRFTLPSLMPFWLKIFSAVWLISPTGPFKTIISIQSCLSR